MTRGDDELVEAGCPCPYDVNDDLDCMGDEGVGVEGMMRGVELRDADVFINDDEVSLDTSAWVASMKLEMMTG